MSLTLVKKPEYEFGDGLFSRWNAIHQQEGIKFEYQRKDFLITAWEDYNGKLKITISATAGLVAEGYVYLYDNSGIYTPGFYEIFIVIDATTLALVLAWNGEGSDGFINSDDKFPNYNILAEIYTIQEDIIGKNLIKGGDFSSWDADNPKYWTVEGESGTDPEISEVAPNEGHGGTGLGACNIYSTNLAVNIYQNILTIDKIYLVEIEITKIINGDITFQCGVDDPWTPLSTEDIHKLIKTCTGNNIFSIKRNDVTCDVTIDNVSVREIGSSNQLIFTPDTKGLVKVDSVSALKMVSSFDESSLYDTVNIRDANASGRFKVRVKEQWTGSSESWGSFSDTFYHTNSARQLKEKYGKNMYEYLLWISQELLLNGNFSIWETDNPKYWLVTGESGTDPEISEVGVDEGHGGAGTGSCNIYSTNLAVNIYQNILTIDKIYLVEIEITKIINGDITFQCGVDDPWTPLSTEDIHKLIKTCTGNNIFSIKRNDVTCDVTIDNVSVREISVANFLIKFTEPKRFTGYPWDISIIYSELLSGETLILKETSLDINNKNDDKNLIIGWHAQGGGLNNFDVFTSSGTQITSVVESLPNTGKAVLSKSYVSEPDEIGFPIVNGEIIKVICTVIHNSGTLPYILVSKSSHYDPVSNEVRLVAGMNDIDLLVTETDNTSYICIYCPSGEEVDFSTSGEIIVKGSIKLTNLDDGEIEYVNRIVPQKEIGAADAYTKIEILRDNTPDVLLSEEKIIINDQDCKDNPIYLRWINLLGGREYWLFSHHQEYGLEIYDINLIERNISNIETAEAIQDIISKEAKESIIIGEDNLPVSNVDGMKGLLLSPLVQMLTNPASWENESPKWKTVIVKKNTWNLYRNDRGTYSLELEIGLPRLNIQTR